MNSPCWLRWIVGVAVVAGVGAAVAQESLSWSIPGQSIPLDFGSKDLKTEVVFIQEGMAWETPVDFLMVKHKRVTVEAKLPEPGEFVVEQTNPKARVEVVRKGPLKVEVVAKVSAMSASDATNRARKTIRELGKPLKEKLRPEANKLSEDELRAFLRDHGLRIPGPPPKGGQGQGDQGGRLERMREAYLDFRILDDLAPELRRRLEELADEKSKWIEAAQRRQWANAEPMKLLDEYSRLLPYQILDEYLHDCGLDFDGNVRAYKPELEGRARAVYLILTGEAGWYTGTADTALKSLGPKDREALRTAFSVNLRCRFVPQVDPEDPNAQWNHGQRVAARAPGVSRIRVRGSLDPGGHDRVDWWLVDKYERGATPLEFNKDAGFRVETYPFDGGARLRVVATGEKRSDYALEFPAPNSTRAVQEVEICESPSRVGTKFPY